MTTQLRTLGVKVTRLGSGRSFIIDHPAMTAEPIQPGRRPAQVRTPMSDAGTGDSGRTRE